MMYKTLLLDDEPRALEVLDYHLRPYDKLNIVARCGDLQSAIQAARQHQPQLAILDIQVHREEIYPLLDELALLTNRPAIIFVTAHARKHIQRIVDSCSQRFQFGYLSKPVESDLLATQLERFFTGGNSAQRLVKKDKLVISRGKAQHLIAFKDIVYTESAGNYTDVYYQEEERLRKVVFTGSLNSLMEELPGPLFYRISARHCINTSFLRGTENNYSFCVLETKGLKESVRLVIPEKKRARFRREVL
jgi:DNA-binding LytR/AlgR family response regulator